MAERLNNTITHLRLPFTFDRGRLLEDYYVLSNQNWTPHFNRDGYEGKWNAIALYAKEDENSAMISLDESDKLVPTTALKSSPYFQEVLSTFQTKLLSARILRLEVGSVIKPHSDYKLGYEDDCFRLHIPIITNSEVEFIVGGNRLQMSPGECWYTNVNHVHSVANFGSEDRIHLVIDCERNAWSDDMFFKLAPEAAFFAPPTVKYTKEELERMIEELERMNYEGNADLIAELNESLKEINEVDMN